MVTNPCPLRPPLWLLLACECIGCIFFNLEFLVYLWIRWSCPLCIIRGHNLPFQTPNTICVKVDTKISNKQQPSYTTKLLIAKTDQNPGAMYSVPCRPRAVFLMVCIFVIFSSFHLISLVFFYFLSCSSFFRMLPNNGRKKPCSPLDGGNPADYRLKNSYRVVQDFFCPLQSTWSNLWRLVIFGFRVIHVLHFPVVVLVLCCCLGKSW